MKETPVGTMRGRDDSGQSRSISVSKSNDSYILTNAKHERQTVMAGNIEELLSKVEKALQLKNIEFIPAHGALGAKGPEISSAADTSQPS